MSSKKKGDRRELESYRILESQGYIVNPAPRTMRRIFAKGRLFFVSQRNDHWGLFDGEAKQNKRTLYFQIKSDQADVSKAKKGIEEFYKKYCNEYETCEIWLRVKIKGFVIYHLKHQNAGNVMMNPNGEDIYEFGEFIWKKRYINLKGEECEPFKIKEKGDKNER